MRAFYVDADFAPKPGYQLSELEMTTKRSLRGNSIWKNIRGEVTERPDPKPKADEVLLKVGVAGICGTDTHIMQMDNEGYTKYDGHSRYPCIIGHEFSGEVIELGSTVKTLKAGDLVSVESISWCGECEACRKGMFNQCRNKEEQGITYDGGFAEYVTVKAKYCYLLNDILKNYGDKMTAFEMGAMIEPVGVAYNGLFIRGGGINPGEHAAVFGAGPIGLSAIALLRASGVAKLVCFEATEERRQLAKDCGADYIYDPISMKKQGINSSDVLMDITNGQGISLFAECAGANNATYPVMEGALAICGKTVQIGHSIGKMTIDIHPYQMNGGYISGSNGPSGHGIYTNVSALMASGRIDMRKMVTGKLHLEDIKEGFVQASNGTSGKILISLTYPRKK